MTRQPTILLIDDDLTLANMYQLKFRLDGTYRFLTAGSPEEGIRMAEDTRPDLILLDLILPKRSGLPLELNKEAGFITLANLRARLLTKRIPVVILTNLDELEEDNVERAKVLGAVDYWVKALHQPADVLAKVKHLLGSVSATGRA